MQLPLSSAGLSALDLAHEESQARNHKQTDTGHLLLGLLGEPEGTGAAALAELDGTVEAVREAVEERWAADAAEHARWKFPHPVGEFPPLSIEAGEAVRRAGELAGAAGHDLVGPADLLLALLDGRGLAREALHTLGLTTFRARESLARRLLG
jgi:ATP-dependent Clp protease ATP-binding subunit ClpA